METVFTTKDSGISMEELSRTDAWKSLDGYLKRLLVQALESRNLPAAVAARYPNLDKTLQRKIADELLSKPAVRQVIDLYALGVTAAPLPEATPAPVAPSADVPVSQGEAVAPAEVVN